MDLYLIGAAAAVLTSGLWTINAVLFTSAGKRIGAISVNAWRILFAFLLLWATQAIIFGQFFPDATNETHRPFSTDKPHREINTTSEDSHCQDMPVYAS